MLTSWPLTCDASSRLHSPPRRSLETGCGLFFSLLLDKDVNTGEMDSQAVSKQPTEVEAVGGPVNVDITLDANGLTNRCVISPH